MAKPRKFDFHGHFPSKEAAKTKEAEVPGSFIIETKVDGKPRFFVVTRKDK